MFRLKECQADFFGTSSLKIDQIRGQVTRNLPPISALLIFKHSGLWPQMPESERAVGCFKSSSRFQLSITTRTPTLLDLSPYAWSDPRQPGRSSGRTSLRIRRLPSTSTISIKGTLAHHSPSGGSWTSCKSRERDASVGIPPRAVYRPRRLS